MEKNNFRPLNSKKDRHNFIYISIMEDEEEASTKKKGQILVATNEESSGIKF